MDEFLKTTLLRKNPIKPCGQFWEKKILECIIALVMFNGQEQSLSELICMA